MRNQITEARRLAERFSKGADNCRRLARRASEPDTQTIYRSLAASYEGMAAAMMLKAKQAGRTPRKLFVRKSA
jgi:hypothetical protein